MDRPADELDHFYHAESQTCNSLSNLEAAAPSSREALDSLPTGTDSGPRVMLLIQVKRRAARATGLALRPCAWHPRDLGHCGAIGILRARN
jgi:hypothetical protein